MRRISPALALVFAFALAVSAGARAESVKIFAAASLKNAVDEIAASWKQSTGKEVVVSYAASSALAKQIAEGAPADMFISADLAWMDDLEGRGLIAKETRRNLLGNTLVLIAPAGGGKTIDLEPGTDLAAALSGGKLAVAEVKSVPAGRYAKAALEKLGMWAAVEPHLAMSENVRAALTLVARGEAPLGIVYGSDAKAESKVEVVGIFPGDSHPPIIYPAGLVAGSANPDAKEFFAFLASETAGKIFASQGFQVLK
jgi:molybdate transport system substrate-binding protein